LEQRQPAVTPLPIAARADPAPDLAPDALYARGVALWNGGRRPEAIALLDAALRGNPEFPEALCMAAFVLGQSGKPAAALQFYRRAIGLKIEQPTAWSNAGKILFEFERYEEALAAFDAALALRPDHADSWNSRAGALRKLGRLADSAAAAREALRLRPDFAEAALNLGTALFKLGRSAEALEAYRLAASNKPDYADALCGAGLALRALDRLREARDAFEAAERLGNREAISGKACLDLTLGDFERGWVGYEARWISGKSLAEALGARFPTWRGPGKAGERVLVMNDHGLGDTIQFARYIPMIVQSGAIPTFLGPAKMLRLLASLPGGARRVERTDEGEAFDAQIAISSLPGVFGTRLDSVPASIPYLRAEPELVERWAPRIGAAGFKIGVVWQGNADPEVDMARAVPLSAFAPLAALRGVRLISLQKGAGVEQLDMLPRDMRVETLGDDFDAGPDAFLDAAAAMAHLDLVVTCDTSIAHLAGALGRPVWVALKKDAEWRWLRDRDDSPWYPTMRLFRQTTSGDWDGVFAEIAKSVSAAMREREGGRLISIPGAVGELVDKITILEIKSRRIADADKLRNVRRELALLEDNLREAALDHPEFAAKKTELAIVNELLWDVEDEIRLCEKSADFGDGFIALARAVYATNDRRAALKRDINRLFDSAIVEEKCYA
jgi:tetratricopeptide (TPR) repeat protein